MRRLLTIILLCAATTAGAAERNLLFILDASGSMWGRIDDTPKISVAKEVMTDLVRDLPAGSNAGLLAYGHRRKGDCSDIESLVEFGPLDREAMIERIQGLNPKGKTPITAAVKQAVDQLRQIEASASVILVSDGLESCDGDPCEAVKEARKSGVDFRLHVIGFDLGDADPGQLQCMAEAGGGEFYTAANVDELTGALEQVTAEPAKVDVTIQAVAGEGGDAVTEGLLWTLERSGSDEPVLADYSVSRLHMALVPGRYRASVERTSDGASFEREIDVVPELEQSFELPLPPRLPDASISAPESAPAGGTAQVEWSGPEYDGDYIAVDEAGKSGGRFPINSQSIEQGSPLELLMPPEPGDYELRYVQKQDFTVLASQPISVEPTEAGVSGPQTAAAGSTITVEWKGPEYDGDYIAVDEAGKSGGRFPINSQSIEQGSPLELLMPPEPGDYELRYVQKQDFTVLASQPISVEPTEAGVSGPQTAAAGSTITVEWNGPEYDGDYIAVDEAGKSGGRFPINSQSIEQGSPLELLMPPEPGDYELRYVQKQDFTVLASQPISVEPTEAGVSGPQTAAAGSTITVEWNGPEYDGDYIAVDEAGKSGGRFPINSQSIEQGSPLELLMPPEPGDYELRYVQKQDYTVLASQPISVEPTEAGVSGPQTAAAGSTITVEWNGPEYDGDYIAVDEAGKSGGRFPINSQSIEQGSPLELLMPPEPGDYELRYVQKQDYTVLASQPISVEPTEAGVSGPQTAAAGSTITVEWSGPEYDGDYIAVDEAGKSGGRFPINSQSIEQGSPLELLMPEEPGTYELRYVQKQGYVVLERQDIRVE